MNFKLWLEAKWNFGTGGELPSVYIRFGDIPTNKHGQQIRSTHGRTGEYEAGVSVYAAYYDRLKKKFILQGGSDQLVAGQQEVLERPVYLVTGEEINDEGDDGEPLLKPGTIRIIRKLNLDEIIDSQDYWRTLSGIELDKKNEPNIPDVVNKTSYSKIKTIRLKALPYIKEISQKFKTFSVELVYIFEHKNQAVLSITTNGMAEEDVRQLYYLLKNYDGKNKELMWHMDAREYSNFTPIKLFTVKNGQISI